MATAILFKLIKTEQQENAIQRYIMSPWTSSLSVRPVIGSKNILINLIDEKGREDIFKVSPEGIKIR